MPTFNRERAKTELGWTDTQIDSYLASDQARQDSSAVQAPASGGSDPLGMAGGMASAAVDAIGGPRTILTAALGGGGLFGAKKLIDYARRGMTPPPPGGPPPTPPTPAVAAKQAAATIASSPALASESPKTLQAVRELLLKKPAKSAYSKITGVFDEPVTTAKGRVVGAIKPKVPRGTSAGETVPIKVQDRPAAVRGVKQRGVTKREIASRQKGMAASAKPPVSDLETQLKQSVQFEREMAKRGIPVAQRVALRRGAQSLLRGGAAKLPGAIGLLMMLKDAGSLPEQIDEAGSEVRRAIDPRLARYLEGQSAPEGI